MPGTYDSGASLTSRRFHGQPSQDLPQGVVGQRIEHPIQNGGLMTDFKHGSTQSASQMKGNLCRFRLAEILEPIADRLQVLERQPDQTRLHLLYAAHGHTVAQRYGGFKPRPGVEDCGTGRKLVETGHDGSVTVTVTRDPNSPIRVRGLSGPNEVSLHPSSLKESPVQAWFDATGQFIILETPGQRAQVWDAATGLPVTPTFASRYATSEAEYRTVKLPTFPKSQIANRKSEILSGSRLDGTGDWKPLEPGEIVARWSELDSNLNERLPSVNPKGHQ